MSYDETEAGADATQAGPSGEPTPQPRGRRERHDAFTGRKKRNFLKALGKSGCVLDACRAAGIGHSAAYSHYESDDEFRRSWDLALSMSSTTAELVVWERAVVGVEEDVIQYGKIVGKRMRRSDHLLKLLLQGSNPKKYGPRPGFTRKRILAAERKQMEREIHARILEAETPIEEVRQSILDKVEAIGRHDASAKIAAGWTLLPDGAWIPPGWVRAEGAEPGHPPPLPERPEDGAGEAWRDEETFLNDGTGPEEVCDSMSMSSGLLPSGPD